MSEPHTSGLICEFMWVYVCRTHFVCVQLQFNVKAVCCVRTMVQLLCLCLCGDLAFNTRSSQAILQDLVKAL